MIFKSRIKNIRKSDLVLDIGPGGEPHPRADVLLEKRFESELELQKQSGFQNKLITNKKVVEYSGGSFPFADKEFDYVICSQVLEHVDDVPFFLKELSRIGKKGYIEYPTIYYEYLYNFDVHQNILKKHGELISWQKKSFFDFSKFLPLREFFYNTLAAGESALIDKHKNVFFEGFEWFDTIHAEEAKNVADFTAVKEEFHISQNFFKKILRRIVSKIQIFI